MRNSILIMFVMVLTSLNSFAQCEIDYDTSTPDTSNFNLAPIPLPNGIVGELYQQDMTFILPEDTADPGSGFLVTFTDFHIVSIALPPGLEWQCNISDCHYDPSISPYGCVNISGNPLVAGFFDVEVTLVATHDYSSIIGTETIVFDIPLEIENLTASNDGFSMSPPAGCASLTVDFINNNPGLSSYYWDFGNGTMSYSENPGSQIYENPGEYYVYYEAFSTNESSYILTDITIAAAANWGNTWGDEENLGITDPDPYFNLYNEQGEIIYQSSVLDETNFPASWNVGNIPLENQTYLIDAWEQDGTISADDDLGSVTFGGHDYQQSGTYTINNGSLTIDYTIIVVNPTPITFNDTIIVYATPENPIISFDEFDNELNLISSYFEEYSYNWFYNNAQINGFQASLEFAPQYSGYYQLQAVNQSGCYSISDHVLACASNVQPMLNYEDNLILVLDSSMYENATWYHNDLQILGIDQFHYFTDNSGDYYMIGTDLYGCEYTSETITSEFHSADISEQSNSFIDVYPNPFKTELKIFNSDYSRKLNVFIYDFMGRLVYENNIINSSTLNLVNLPKGLYLLEIYEQETKLKSLKLEKF